MPDWLDTLGSWPTAVVCAVVAVLAVGWGAWQVWAALSRTGAVPASRGLLTDLRVASALLDAHVAVAADEAERAALLTGRLGERGPELAATVDALRTDLDELRWLLGAPGRVLAELRERFEAWLTPTAR